ncbi:MAG: FAD-dependent oxidoreductase [Chloroflexota bacterium]
MPQTIHKSEVVVIGAGAVGASIAYQLARRGKDVTLLDKSEPGRGTSHTNFGLVWTQTGNNHRYVDFAIQSTLLWPELVNELGEDVDFRPGGGLSLCLTEDDLARRAAQLEEQRKSVLFEGRMLTPEEVFEIQPGVSREILGALWSPHDGDVNWVKWTEALLRGCRRAGIHLMAHTPVLEIVHDSQSVIQGVMTPAGRIDAEQVVVAAGIWSKQLLAEVGIAIDLYPLRGQILVTEPTEMICPLAMSTVRQEPHGRFFMGVTYEEVGFDRSITPEAYHAIRDHAAKLVPATQDLQVMTHFAGLRPMPGDGLPIVGPIEQMPGLYVAVGHAGITLSPIHGRVISDLIVEGETPYAIDEYDPMRFKDGTFGTAIRVL